jgi:hypothetical protein
LSAARGQRKNFFIRRSPGKELYMANKEQGKGKDKDKKKKKKKDADKKK